METKLHKWVFQSQNHEQINIYKPIKYSETVNHDIQFTSLKETVHPIMKMCWKCIHPQAIQDGEFVSSLELICRNLALHHLLADGSSLVNGCRQNESTKVAGSKG